MRKDTQRRYSKRTRKRGALHYAAFAILTVVAVLSAAAMVPAEDKTALGEEPTYTPYYMTEEYRLMKLKEQKEAEAEAEKLKASIEAYQAEQERLAEEEFKQMQEEYKEPEELPYPFNTMSQDYSADDIEGFNFYEIPSEYSDYGGYFPEAMQIYLWCVCKAEGFDYPTAVAMIEQESAYQYDCIGEASDSGYFQVVPKYHKDRMQKLSATDLLNPYQNAIVAIDYLTELLDKYDGNYAKTLTAYNYGPQGAYKYYFSAGVDANPYAKKVLKKAERIRKKLQSGKD